jgi:hypothetical protein
LKEYSGFSFGIGHWPWANNLHIWQEIIWQIAGKMTVCSKISGQKDRYMLHMHQLYLKNISYWHDFTTKIMSICPIWNFTLYITQSLHFSLFLLYILKNLVIKVFIQA